MILLNIQNHYYIRYPQETAESENEKWDTFQKVSASFQLILQKYEALFKNTL